MRFVRRLLGCSLLIAAAFLIMPGACVPPSRVSAQNAGTVGIQATEIQVFNNRATASTVTSAILPDFGFAANYVQFRGTSFTGVIDIEWTPPSPYSGSAIILTQASIVDNNSHTLQLGGYSPNMVVRITNTGSGGTVNAWYKASSAPIPFAPNALGSNGATSPIVCDHTAYQSIGTGSTGSPFSIINTGDVIVICGFSLSFNGATSAGNVQLGWSASGCPATVTTWESYTTASTPQFISVPFQQRSSSPSTADIPCVANNSGATVYIDLNYASIAPGLL